MGRKAKRLRLIQKLAARQTAANPSVGKENSVAIEELKKAVEEVPEQEQTVDVSAEEEEKVPEQEQAIETVEKPKTTRRKRSPRSKSKSSK
jgi:hypothetical protein